MKLTIITVCKNAEKDIERTIKSVIFQTFPNIEHIIIDGNSKDGTADIVTKYKSHISSFVSEPDSGLYQAMNKGIRKASGDLICFLNAGDVLTWNYSAETVVHQTEKAPACNLFFANILFINETKRGVELLNPKYIQDKTDLYSMSFYHPSTFYRPTLFTKYGFFNENYIIASDSEWNMEALLNGREQFRVIDFAYAVFYSGGLSSSEKFNEQRLREREVMLNKYYSTLERKIFQSKTFKNFKRIRPAYKMFQLLAQTRLNREY